MNIKRNNFERDLSDFYFLSQPNEEDDGIEFYLTLCFDVFDGILEFGDRCQLTILEGVGQRFHHLVEEWFGERPFLRLDLDIQLKLGFAFLVRYKLKFIVNDFI